jgi:hypothetical protein
LWQTDLSKCQEQQEGEVLEIRAADEEDHQGCNHKGLVPHARTHAPRALARTRAHTHTQTPAPSAIPGQVTLLGSPVPQPLLHTHTPHASARTHARTHGVE